MEKIFSIPQSFWPKVHLLSSMYINQTVCTYVPTNVPLSLANCRTNLHQILHRPSHQLREGSLHRRENFVQRKMSRWVPLYCLVNFPDSDGARCWLVYYKITLLWMPLKHTKITNTQRGIFKPFILGSKFNYLFDTLKMLNLFYQEFHK